MHRLTLALITLAAATVAARAADKPAPKGADMDYGPVFASSLALPGGKGMDQNVLAHKSLTIKVGDNAYVSFDADLMRYAAGWTGNWLDLSKTHMTSPKGSQCPEVAGKIVFTTKAAPGVSHKGSLADPRTTPGTEGVGPLPRAHARFTGHYVRGDKVVLAYTAGGGRVLEQPGAMPAGDAVLFTRAITLEKTGEPLTFALADDAPANLPVQLVGIGAPAGAKIVRDGASIRLTVPAVPDAASFTVVLGDAAAATFPADSPDLRRHLAPGPRRFKDDVTTAGTLGKPAADFPYAVDTLTVPFDNPYKSWMRLTGVDFFKDGKSAAVTTWNGDVWVVSGIDDTLAKLTWRRFAAGLYEPLGVKVVDDKVYVRGRDQITRLHDTNADGEADFYENFNNDTPTGVGYHLFKFDLDTDAAGNFYYGTCGTWVRKELLATHGRLYRVSADGSTTTPVGRGLRAPNGLGVGPDGSVVCSDNQGNWTPTSRINLIPPGKTDGFYGFAFDPKYEKELDLKREYPAGVPAAYDPPLCWIPYTQDHSSGGQTFVTSDKWGPFKGNVVHTAYGDSRMFIVMHELVDNVPQGGVWRMPLNFESGVMRPRFNPVDGQLYVAGLRGWQTNGAKDACLHRVRYTGGPNGTGARAPRDLRVTSSGLSITFTDPLDPATAADPGSYDIEQWNYRWSSAYGSPEWSVENPTKKGRDTVEVKSAKLSPDGKTVTLEIPSIAPVMQMSITYKLKSAAGQKVEGAVYNTINKVK